MSEIVRNRCRSLLTCRLIRHGRSLRLLCRKLDLLRRELVRLDRHVIPAPTPPPQTPKYTLKACKIYKGVLRCARKQQNDAAQSTHLATAMYAPICVTSSFNALRSCACRRVFAPIWLSAPPEKGRQNVFFFFSTRESRVSRSEEKR